MNEAEKTTKEEIEEIVIHELAHFLIAPLQSDKRNMEITVTMVGRALKGIEMCYHDNNPPPSRGKGLRDGNQAASDPKE